MYYQEETENMGLLGQLISTTWGSSEWDDFSKQLDRKPFIARIDSAGNIIQGLKDNSSIPDGAFDNLIEIHTAVRGYCLYIHDHTDGMNEYKYRIMNDARNIESQISSFRLKYLHNNK